MVNRRRIGADEGLVTGAPGQEVESLAAVTVGQEVEIVRVLLRPAPGGDPHHRLRPGRQWRCHYSGAATLLLTGRAGETISVSRDIARYIEVRRIDAPGNESTAARRHARN